METQGGKEGAAEKKHAKRGKWTPEQRKEIVAASLVAGASINEVAQRFGIRPNLLTAWRRRQGREIAAAKPKSRRARFAAVRIKAAVTDARLRSITQSAWFESAGSLTPGCCARCWR